MASRRPSENETTRGKATPLSHRLSLCHLLERSRRTLRSFTRAILSSERGDKSTLEGNEMDARRRRPDDAMESVHAQITITARSRISTTNWRTSQRQVAWSFPSSNNRFASHSKVMWKLERPFSLVTVLISRFFRRQADQPASRRLGRELRKRRRCEPLRPRPFVRNEPAAVTRHDRTFRRA